ncbi:MAG: GLPGLI family protein [Lutibacter sp.]|uniref:GLPGLI family protein n=1 Tax=Lutibacter sp. TaxID=1925666 RepID=UPI0019E309BD|nr:GLPGLI family protein [Lutibacter sp.]NOR29336.1 GLPGLI family protein [Lutibacter sp.]
MKKYVIVLVLTYITSSNVYSQSIYGEVHYSKELVNKSKSKANENINSYLSNKDYELKNIFEELNYILRFRDFESAFFVENLNFEVEENRYYRLALLLGGGGGSWYLDLKQNVRLREVEAFGQEFIIKNTIDDLNWNMHNETKKIGNYLCYKATTIYVVKNSKGTFNHPVEAWYTSEIPIGFGPIGYGGLPGLIVELSVQNIKYSISKVVLNPKKQVTIKKPSKGKVVSEEEFNAIGKEAMGNFRSKNSN